MTQAERAQYHFLKLILTGLSIIPRPWMGRLATPLGKLWYQLDRRHRAIARENMHRALGNEMDERTIDRTVRNNFIQLTRVALEIPSLLKLNADNVNQYITLSGRRHLADARARGKGTLLLTGHLGHWELMSMAGALVVDMSADVVAQTLKYAPLDKFLTEFRMRTGNQVINKKKAGAHIARSLKKNRTVAILLDQNASYYEGVYVPFFGITACTNKGLAMFALRHDATVLPTFNVRRADGRYHVMIAPPVPLVRTGSLRRDIVLNTQRFNEVTERYIRMAPDNWLWVHRRWLLKKIPESARRKVSSLSLQPLPEHIWMPGK